MTLARWFRKARPAPTGLRAAARTDVGTVRKVNEDRVLDRTDARLWAVADGMGGMSAGDVAAQAVVDAIAALADVSDAALDTVLVEASEAILAQGEGRSGATVVAAHLSDAAVTIHWAGDSRAYQVRGTQVRQLTRDHSVVQDMVDAGLLDAAEADGHPRANVITRALGVTPGVAIATVRVPVLPGDRLLLCSDGVSRSLRLRDLVGEDGLDTVADRILAGALERDGSDNASLVMIQI